MGGNNENVGEPRCTPYLCLAVKMSEKTSTLHNGISRYDHSLTAYKILLRFLGMMSQCL